MRPSRCQSLPVLFVIRNKKQFAEALALTSCRISLIRRGEECLQDDDPNCGVADRLRHLRNLTESLKISLVSAGKIPPEGSLDGSAQSCLRPPADRTACGACEKTFGTGPSFAPLGRRPGPFVSSPDLSVLILSDASALGFSGDAGSFDPRPAPRRSGCFNPVPSVFFRAVECFIRRLQDEVGIRFAFLRRRNAYTHSD